MNSAVDIAWHLAEALQQDKLFQHMAQQRYGKAWQVESGFDKRRMDWKQCAPFVVFVPAKTTIPASMPKITHDIGIVFCVNDKEHEARVASTVSELSGIRFLGNEAWNCALDCIGKCLGTFHGLRIEDILLEYNAESHPFLYLDAVLTIQENIPIGSR